MSRPSPHGPLNLAEAIGDVVVGYENSYYIGTGSSIDSDNKTILVRDILPAHAIRKLAEDIPAYLRQKWMPLS